MQSIRKLFNTCHCVGFMYNSAVKMWSGKYCQNFKVHFFKSITIFLSGYFSLSANLLLRRILCMYILESAICTVPAKVSECLKWFWNYYLRHLNISLYFSHMVLKGIKVGSLYFLETTKQLGHCDLIGFVDGCMLSIVPNSKHDIMHAN